MSRLVFGTNAEAPGYAARRPKHEATHRAPKSGLAPIRKSTMNHRIRAVRRALL